MNENRIKGDGIKENARLKQINSTDKYWKEAESEEVNVEKGRAGEGKLELLLPWPPSTGAGSSCRGAGRGDTDTAVMTVQAS